MALIRLNNQSISSVTALPSGVGGKILQVQSTFIDTHFTQSITGNTATALNNLTVDITPSSASSKIMILGRLFCEPSTTDQQNSGIFFFRDSTKIRTHDSASVGSRNDMMVSLSTNYTAQDANSTPETFNGFTIDSPSSTSQITYKIGYINGQSCTLNVNRVVSSTNSSIYEAGSSEIIVMEIGA